MKSIDLPREEAAKIAARALEIAKANAPKAKYDSTNSAERLEAYSGEGRIGVSARRARHLMAQNSGAKSFVHRGRRRIIPIRQADGSIVFRMYNPNKAGKYKSAPAKNLYTRDEKGNLIVRTVTPRHWTHPGLQPQMFMQDALKQAIKEYFDSKPKAEIFKMMRDSGAFEDKELFGFMKRGE